MGSDIRISVVVPTYNRGNKLQIVLKSLSKQTYLNFEVIIINDGSTDNTYEALNCLQSLTWPFKLNIVHQENKGRSGSRNTGFRLASADLIVSIDDDMRLDSHCLEEHYKHHLLYPGSILAGEQKEDPQAAKTDFQSYIAHARKDWIRLLQKASYPMKPEEIYITAANFSISKGTFEKIGGFDENLRAVVDYDLAMRATMLGVPIYYNPNAFGWHDDFVTCKWYINRRRQGTENERKLMELKPELVGQFHRYKDKEPSSKTLKIYSILGHSFWVRIIDSFNFLPYILPRKIRYRLYPAIVTALGKYFPTRSI